MIFLDSIPISTNNFEDMLNLALTRELLEGEAEGLLKLPTDKALLEHTEFRCYVELYAKVMLLALFLFACNL